MLKKKEENQKKRLQESLKNRKTLDIQHTENLQKIQENKEHMKNIQDALNDIHVQIQSWDDKKKERHLSEEEIDMRLSLVDKKLDLEEELNKRKQGYDENMYYTETSDILFHYYNLLESGNNECENTMNNVQENSILSFFRKTPASSSDAVPSTTSLNTEPSSNNQKTYRNSKSSLFQAYLSILDKDFIPQMHYKASTQCPVCKSQDMELMSNEGYLLCMNCNTVENIIIEHEKPSYKDPPKEISYFCYKRGNHLNEWILQIQGKESTEIPDEVYDKILFELRKQRISNMATLSQDKVRKILKKLRLNKYYEHIPHIIYRLNGLPNPNLEPELEEKLRNMFRQVQGPFLKYSPRSRKNFLSYPYVLYKFFQLLDLDDYLASVSLLKSRDKLLAQDEIWKLICRDLGWEFIRSL